MTSAWNKAVFATSAALCLLAVDAVADGEQRRFEVTPLLGYITGGSFSDELTNQELDLDDGSAVGLQLNFRKDNQRTWELHYLRQESRTATAALPSIDVTIDKFEFGGTYETNQEPTRPYAAATLGVTHFEPQDSAFRDDTYFSFSIGGGVKFFADRQFGITIDVRWIGAVIDEDTDVFCLSANGLTCLIQTEAGLLSQFRVLAGFNARF